MMKPAISHVGCYVGEQECRIVYVFHAHPGNQGDHVERFSETLGLRSTLENYTDALASDGLSIMWCITAPVRLGTPLKHAWTASRTLAGGEAAIEECWIPCACS